MRRRMGPSRVPSWGRWRSLGRLWYGSARQVEEAVIAVLHILEHLEQERFPVTSRLFPLERGLLTGLGVTELLLEQSDHVQVDIRRIQF